VNVLASSFKVCKKTVQTKICYCQRSIEILKTVLWKLFLVCDSKTHWTRTRSSTEKISCTSFKHEVGFVLCKYSSYNRYQIVSLVIKTIIKCDFCSYQRLLLYLLYEVTELTKNIIIYTVVACFRWLHLFGIFRSCWKVLLHQGWIQFATALLDSCMASFVPFVDPVRCRRSVIPRQW
jgi:hypothetical protein